MAAPAQLVKNAYLTCNNEYEKLNAAAYGKNFIYLHQQPAVRMITEYTRLINNASANVSCEE